MSSKQLDLPATMLSSYGPVMGGADLRRALGYGSYAAFRLARAKGELGVRVFKLPSRRGVFGLTTEVAAWLTHQANRGLPIADPATTAPESKTQV